MGEDPDEVSYAVKDYATAAFLFFAFAFAGLLFAFAVAYTSSISVSHDTNLGFSLALCAFSCTTAARRIGISLRRRQDILLATKSEHIPHSTSRKTLRALSASLVRGARAHDIGFFSPFARIFLSSLYSKFPCCNDTWRLQHGKKQFYTARRMNQSPSHTHFLSLCTIRFYNSVV